TEEISSRPDVQRLLTTSTDFAKATQQLASAVDRWPANMADQTASLRQLVADVQAALSESQTLAKQVQQITSDGRAIAEAMHQTAEATDRMLTRFENTNFTATTMPSRPFDIREYSQTISDLTPALKELNQVLASTDQLAGSAAWQQRLRDV